MCKSLVLATMILTLGMGAAALARDDGDTGSGKWKSRSMQ